MVYCNTFICYMEDWGHIDNILTIIYWSELLSHNDNDVLLHTTGIYNTTYHIIDILLIDLNTSTYTT